MCGRDRSGILFKGKALIQDRGPLGVREGMGGW